MRACVRASSLNPVCANQTKTLSRTQTIRVKQKQQLSELESLWNAQEADDKVAALHRQLRERDEELARRENELSRLRAAVEDSRQGRPREQAEVELANQGKISSLLSKLQRKDKDCASAAEARQEPGPLGPSRRADHGVPHHRDAPVEDVGAQLTEEAAREVGRVVEA